MHQSIPAALSREEKTSGTQQGTQGNFPSDDESNWDI